jgi:hypothetical protein
MREMTYESKASTILPIPLDIFRFVQPQAQPGKEPEPAEAE